MPGNLSLVAIGRGLVVGLLAVALLIVGGATSGAQPPDPRESRGQGVDETAPKPTPTPAPGKGSDQAPPLHDRPQLPLVSSAEEALGRDAEILARDTGRSVAESLAALRFQQDVSRIVDDLDPVVGWFEIDPFAQTARVDLVGDATVASSQFAAFPGVEVRGGALYTRQEQAWRALQAGEALAGAGLVTAVAPTSDGRLRVEVSQDIPAERLDRVMSQLPRQAQDRARAEPLGIPNTTNHDATVFAARDFVVEQVAGQVGVELTAARGGEELTGWNGTKWTRCTSAFTARIAASHLNAGTTGVTTAAHCTDSPDIKSHIRDNQIGVWHWLYYGPMFAHHGYWGDYAFYETDGIELPEFRASSWQYRTQTGTRTAGNGSFVCVYGHVSWHDHGINRTCDHQILGTGLSVNANGTVVGFQHKVSHGASTINGSRVVPGDSGAGVSMGLTADGIVASQNLSGWFYTPINHALWAMGLELMT